MNLRLRVVTPCDQDWASMAPRDRGRHCHHCDKEVLDLTELAPSVASDLLASADQAPCIRYRERDECDSAVSARGCATDGPRILAIAAVATTMLSACTRFPYSDANALAARNEANLTPVAACKESWDTGYFPDGPPTFGPDVGESSDSQRIADGICDVDPSAPGCDARPIMRMSKPYALEHRRFPDHFRAECDGHRIKMGEFAKNGDERTWPAGPDVVLTAFAAWGVPDEATRQVASHMLEQLGLSYSALVAENPRRPPQGSIFLAARLSSDGKTQEVEVATSAGLPAAVVDRTLAALRAEQFPPSEDELSSVEMTLHFVFRKEPEPQDDP